MAKELKTQGFVFNAFDLIKFIWEKKWILILVSTAAFIAAIIVSLLITPRFQSTVVMFPAASVSISKNLVETSAVTSDTKDILSFGEDEESERLLQILHSDMVRKHIIEKFNLLQHYEIDAAKTKYPYTQLNSKYKSNVKFRRTEFTSIEIDILDEDPQMAADIANEVSSFVDSVYFQIKYGRAKEAFHIVEREFNTSKESIEKLTDSLQIIRNLGIHDYESQAEALNNAYANALLANNNYAIKMIQEKMNIMAKYGGNYVELTYKLEWEIERFSLLKAKFAAAKVNLESTISNVFIVDKAGPAEKKATPKRSIIVIITTLSAFALTLLMLLVIDNFKYRE